VIGPAHPVSENVPGFVNPVVGFEFASRPEHVTGILGQPGTPERAEATRRMVLGTRVDFLFAVAYASIFAGLARLLMARGCLPRGAGRGLYALAAVMAIGDILENRQLLALCSLADAAEMAPVFERLGIITRVTWYAIYAACAIAAVGVWRDTGWFRSIAVLFAAAAVLGFSSILYLPAIEWGSVPLFLGWMATWIRSFRR
jgi:hypothetical protein